MKVCLWCFVAAAVCVEASLWWGGCVLLPLPAALPQAAVCGVAGRSPAPSPPSE